MTAKKKSSYQKGNQLELEVKKTLEYEGWEVFRQHRKPIHINKKIIMVGCDIFGCDLVAKKLGAKPLWIQVSTIDNKHKKVSQVLEFPWNYQHETIQIWCRLKGNKAYEVFEGPDFESVGISKVKGVK